jgi:ketosteroid isomerase-like protein
MRRFDAAARPGLLSGTPMSEISTKRVAVLLAVGFACCGMLSAQHAHRHGPPKRMEKEQVEQLEAQWKQAMLDDDVSAMDKLLAEDYLGVTAGGDLVTKSQQLDRMRNRKLTVTKLDTSDIKVKLIGQIAIVTSLAQLEAVAEGKTVNGQYRYQRVYQRLPSGSWKITSFVASRIPGSGR